MMPDTSPAARMRAMILRDKTGREMEPAPSNEWIPQMIGGGMESAGQAMEDVNSIPGMPMFQNAPRVMGSHLQDMGQMMQEGSLTEQAFAMLGTLGTPMEPLFQNFVGEPIRQGALGLGADERIADIASAVGQIGAGFFVPSMLATAPSKGGKVANVLDEAGMVNLADDLPMDDR